MTRAAGSVRPSRASCVSASPPCSRLQNHAACNKNTHRWRHAPFSTSPATNTSAKPSTRLGCNTKLNTRLTRTLPLHPAQIKSVAAVQVVRREWALVVDEVHGPLRSLHSGLSVPVNSSTLKVFGRSGNVLHVIAGTTQQIQLRKVEQADFGCQPSKGCVLGAPPLG